MLNLSVKVKSTCGLDMDHLQHLGLRLTSSCNTQFHGKPFYLFNTATMEYEQYVNRLKNGDFNLLRTDIYFPKDQQYSFSGNRVAYDKRIINDTTPRVSNSRLSIPLQRSEEPIHGMHQLSADFLKKQLDQLQKKDRNPSVLNSDLVQRNHKIRPSQRLASPVEARQSIPTGRPLRPAFIR